MSTSCIIALYSKEEDEIILLEKTHDGFYETVRFLLNEAVTECGYDLKYIANYLIKKTDVRFSIYSHKYPRIAFLFAIDIKGFFEVEIDSNIKKLKECLPYIQKAINKIELSSEMGIKIN